MIDSMEQEDFDIRNQQPVTSRERDFENALRPLNFEDFSGQDKVVDNLRIFVKAARLRGEALDHVLLHGPPGLGKTTLSNSQRTGRRFQDNFRSGTRQAGGFGGSAYQPGAQ